MRSPLLGAALLATLAATPAVAAPRTIVCGPFTGAGQMASLAPIAFVIDGAVPAAQIVEPNGRVVDITITAMNDHLINLGFVSPAHMAGDTRGYLLAISNDDGRASLALASTPVQPFGAGDCRPGGHFIY